MQIVSATGKKKPREVGLIVDNEGESVYYNESAGLPVPKQPVGKDTSATDSGAFYQTPPSCFKLKTPRYGVN